MKDIIDWVVMMGTIALVALVGVWLFFKFLLFIYMLGGK